jgi:hypothetical protein
MFWRETRQMLDVDLEDIESVPTASDQAIVVCDKMACSTPSAIYYAGSVESAFLEHGFLHQH